MIQINLVARIDDDKNSFLDLVYVTYKLKSAGLTDFKVLYIGGVHNRAIYHNILQMATLLGVEKQIGFTLKAIPLAELPDDVKQGYFLNYSVGAFVGYSAIESINLGFKAIFLNADNELVNEVSANPEICNNVEDMIRLIVTIAADKKTWDARIMENNQQLKQAYLLTAEDNLTLLSLLSPGTGFA